VSLLNRLGRGHLDDAEIARLWTSGEAHPHFETCADCRDRAARFETWLNGIGDELRAEADEAFPTERLAVQHAQIARRLELLERPARVIAFPKAARAVISGHSNVRRWVTVAAAASLIAGFGLGQVMPLRTAVQQQAAAVIKPQSHLTTAEATERAKVLTSPEPTSTLDEELLSDAFRSRVTSLNALDEMTPHARDAGK
jgi:hypothetical protein